MLEALAVRGVGKIKAERQTQKAPSPFRSPLRLARNLLSLYLGGLLNRTLGCNLPPNRTIRNTKRANFPIFLAPGRSAA